MPKITPTKSVSTQLMRIVFALYCVVAVIVTAVHIINEYEYTQSNIEQELTSSEAIFSDVLGKALWSFDREQVRDILNSVMEMPVVVGVSVFDSDNKLVDQLGEIPTESTAAATSNLGLVSYRFDLNYQYQEDPIKMGHAYVYSNSSIVIKRLEVGFIFLIVNAILKGIALWVIFLWISRRILARPLNRLTEEVRKIRFDTLKPMNFEVNAENANEIDTLAQSFSDVVEELIDSKEAIVEFNQTLEKQVQSRTVDLQESKQVAEQALKIKSEFLATMSHEIRTPMNGVLGMLNLMAKTPLNTKQQNYMKMAQSSAESLLVIINDILDFSKIEAGKVNLENIQFEFPTLVHSLMHVMAVKSQKKGIQLQLNSHGMKITDAFGDPHRIRQIMTNLIDNAIKFTQQGSVKVTLYSMQSEKQAKAGRVDFHCIIEDTGIGIPEQKLSHLFENFSQVDSSTTRRFGGTGLGLAISKRLAQLMGGDIQVSSRVGEGSIFRVNIPLTSTGPRDQLDLSMTKLAGKSVGFIFSSEEELSWLESSVEAYAMRTFKGKDADSLFESLGEHSLTEHSLDVVFVNIKSSEADSANTTYSQLKELRSQPQTKEGHIVIAARSDTEFNPETLKQYRVSQVLLEPISHWDILTTLKNIFAPKDIVQTSSTLPSASQKPLRILLVEDNFINQQVVLELLNEQGHHIDTVENGEQALDQLRRRDLNKTYDLILMDCQMPVMDGYTASQHIREGDDLPSVYQSIPIIAMTANTLEGDREKCLQAGMTDYLPKPIVADDLFNCIKQYTPDANVNI